MTINSNFIGQQTQETCGRQQASDSASTQAASGHGRADNLGLTVRRDPRSVQMARVFIVRTTHPVLAAML